MFKRLWPSLILEKQLDFDVQGVLNDIAKNYQYTFDKNSIGMSSASKDLTNKIDNIAHEWFSEAQIGNAEIELSNSWVISNPPIQGMPLHNNHNSELVIMVVLQSGLENGKIHTGKIFPDEVAPINTPLGSPQGDNSIVLVDPRGTAVTLSENGFKLYYEVEPIVGKVLAFPSYLPYYMLPNVGSQERIVLMTNYEIE